ncbi:Lon protease family protein [Lonepinella koalarum]|uniref:endopeptidase La n=1 Tax=Lonepinella koalarum TaxID=53417 RepID=A0A4R1KYB7_9PAST|nr:Lon protease family protein [Lonepinella koalarum]MDH2926917.1 peptidase [Lonepinella koalarum]TCK70424.1 Lon-like ATP-dependent protease [Lonepinella koalarum]TFJ90187.1 Lon protease family protein [Lonepinella koalarum]TYG33702.1 Lon protease family protein [Lonepinella koalarum]
MDLSEQKLDWTALQPHLAQLPVETQKVSFLDLQWRACSAIAQFLKNSHRSLLVLKADDQSEYASEVENWVKLQQAPLQVSGVQYVVEQGDSFSFAQIHIEPAQSVQDNFAAKKTVATALYFDQSSLFGSIRIHPMSHDIQLNAGLVHQLNNGVLILSVNQLLTHFDCWERLKHVLVTKQFDWYSAHPFKALPCEIPSYPLNVKVLLLGNREELATLNELVPDLYHLADYSEIESYIAVGKEPQQQAWQQYVQSFAWQHQFPHLTQDGLDKLYQWLVRESESRVLINSSPLILTQILSGVSLLSNNKDEISAVDVEQYFQQKLVQQGFLREQAYADIFYHQVYIETDHEAVGQINGLSVVEFTGMPMSFGEPSRISCIVQFGDGEIVDIERKSELAGNVHGKGMMIAQNCLANILDLPSQLPFSASLVFEQSYGEIDGDSASLAAFLVLASALSDLPVPQSIAVTGSIDQFGLVHSIGGVNDKIEGFFAICQSRGLTGKQGVIIPQSCLYQLSLTDDVVTAVKNNQFFIWTVNDVFEACEILFDRPLVVDEQTDKAEKVTIAQLIAKRIEQYAEQHHSIPFWLKWFAKK